MFVILLILISRHSTSTDESVSDLCNANPQSEHSMFRGVIFLFFCFSVRVGYSLDLTNSESKNQLSFQQIYLSYNSLFPSQKHFQELGNHFRNRGTLPAFPLEGPGS